MRNERIIEVDILRGIAVICMIIGHSILRYPVDISEVTVCHALEYFIFTFHMELFFVLAGYVYRCKNYNEYILGKVERIFVPYAFFGVVNALLHVYGGNFINGTESLTDSINKVLLYGGEYWFLYTIFIMYAIFPLIEEISSSWKYMIGIMICCSILADIIKAKTFCISLVLYYLPFFAFGYVLRNYGNSIIKSLDRLRLKQIVLIIMLCVLLFAVTDSLYNAFSISIIHIMRALSVILAIYLISKIVAKKTDKTVVVRVLQHCSNYSLQIYLFNGFLLVLYRVLICNILKITNPFLIVTILPILIISTSLIICNLLNKNRYMSIFVGIKQREKK